jgi:voltage-gated potassium channel Kch
MMLREHGRFRSTWDLIALALILVTCVLIPYQAAFRHDIGLAASVVIYAVDLFFLADIALNFRTTYHRGGAEVSDRGAIRRRYLGTLFPVDLLATLPFDLLVLLWAGTGEAALSVVVFLRLLRLLRVVRMLVIFTRWMRRGSSNAGMLRIVRLGACALLLSHWIACAWFLVPYLEAFPADSWVAAHDLQHASAGTQYVRSLYWTVVTMTTVGYGDITPGRDFEYAFTILVMLAGASVYAFIIGNIVSLLSTLDAGKTRFRDRADAVSQYLRSWRAPEPVHERVSDYFDYVWARYHGVPDRRLLADLPESIRVDVLRHVAAGGLESFALFREAPESLQSQLLLALEPRVFVPGDRLLREGEEGGEIVFLSRGVAEVIKAGGARCHATLGAGDHFGELSMLLGERRTGSVVATSYCEAFVLRREEFERMRAVHPELRDLFAQATLERSQHAAELLLEEVVL